MQVGDKIKVTKAIRDCCVLKARAGQTGMVNKLEEKNVFIKLNSGEIIKTTYDKIEPYTKNRKFTIKDSSNEELLDKYDELQKIVYYGSMGTKKWQKANEDSEKIRLAILERMKSNQQGDKQYAYKEKLTELIYNELSKKYVILAVNFTKFRKTDNGCSIEKVIISLGDLCNVDYSWMKNAINDIFINNNIDCSGFYLDI